MTTRLLLVAAAALLVISADLAHWRHDFGAEIGTGRGWACHVLVSGNIACRQR